MKTLEEMKKENVDDTFIQHMVNAMIMSAFKYGKVNEYASKVALNKMQQELCMFMEDGNTEHMVNIANYAMIRYMFPEEGEAYKGTDANKSVIKKGKAKTINEWLHEYIMENK